MTTNHDPGRGLAIGSLFSGGVDGFALGLLRALRRRRATLRWQVESNETRRRMLAQRFPDAKRFGDVRTVGRATLVPVDLICGGFPCRNLSSANVVTRDGLDGEHSGLWSEFRRIVGELMPRWVVVENAPEWRRWVPFVRRDLHELGYASVPVHVRASAFGAPHDRQRVFVVATHADEHGESARALNAEVARMPAIARALRQDWGQPSPGALGVADGVPDRMERLAAVGDAVMPVMAEAIGIAIDGAIEALEQEAA
jgi:DNA (cytosine-5)-methyltransferase 1